MYKSYWKLGRRPFENWADPRFYFPDESRQAALLKLRYAIENRRGAALLAGPSGSGKTMLVGMLRSVLDEEFTPFVHVVFPLMSAEELLAFLAMELTGADHQRQTPGIHRSVRRIQHFLERNTQDGRHAVVILDEAHLIDNATTLEALRLLMNFELAGRAGMTLVLVGQPGILPILDRMPQLEERLGVKCLLRPLTRGETADYVNHRLTVAGAERPMFDVDSLRTLHQLTQGVARRINRLCDLAMLIGFAEQHSTITPEQLESVSRELTIVAPE